MSAYEYKVVPAPKRAKKVKGLKGPADYMAAALEAEINELAVQGWEYVRADLLPVEEKSGMLSGYAETHRAMLVFRRERGGPLRASSGADTMLRRQVEPQGEEPAAAPELGSAS